MDHLVKSLRQQFPAITFTEGSRFCWSPRTHEVTYTTPKDSTRGVWSLLHETGHALLEHSNYRADFELIKLEIAAWERARELADLLEIPIDEDHIQDCLDTYRDWLYKRSICPSCNTKCLQQADMCYYRCFNCHTRWKVSPSRFCRAYRATQNHPASSMVFNASIEL
jgi:hypothetical protein